MSVHYEKPRRPWLPVVAFVLLLAVVAWLMATRETRPDELVPVPPSRSDYR